jgi:hypothetical protein
MISKKASTETSKNVSKEGSIEVSIAVRNREVKISPRSVLSFLIT